MVRKIFVWIVYCSISIGVIGGSFLLGSRLSRTAVVQAQEVRPSTGPVAPGASPFLCTVNNVAAFDSRIHLRCNPADGAIAYFAYQTDPIHSSNANRFLALANTAYALGSKLWVYYDSDPGSNPPGCNPSDCRGFYGLSMVP